MKRSFFFFLFVLIGLVVVNRPPTVVYGQSANATGEANSRASRPRLIDSRGFVQDAWQDNRFEILLGSLALQKSPTDSVKQFAQQMINDHSQTLNTLNTLRRQRRISVRNNYTAEQVEQYNLLNSLDATQFDRAYLSLMVVNHHVDIMNYQNQAALGRDAAVRAFASQQLSTLQGHLGVAMALQDQVLCSAAGTPTPSATATATVSPTATGTGTPTVSPTGSPTATVSGSGNFTPTATRSPTFTATPTATITPGPSFTVTPTPSATVTVTGTPFVNQSGGGVATPPNNGSSF